MGGREWQWWVEWLGVAGVFLGVGAAAGAVARPAPERAAAAAEEAGTDVPAGDPAPVAASAAGGSVPAGGAVLLAGRTIDLSEPIRPQVLAAARGFLSTRIALRAGDETVVFTRAQLGAAVPVAHVADLLERAARGVAAPSRGIARSDGLHELPILVDVQDDVALGRLIALKNRFDREAVPAKIDFVSGEVIPESKGRHLMLYRALATVHDAFEEGLAEVVLPVEVTEPRLDAAAVHGMDFGAVLGWYETQYSRMPEQETRNFNLRHAGEFVDGTILMPGEEWSFNATVGERSEVRGFRVAPVIADGELIDGIGGGTCQIASTTFAASFFAGLELTRRRPHSRPSSYILLGLDATVVYPSIDLHLRNPYDFPVALSVRVDAGKVRVEVRGARKVYDVTFIRDVFQVQPFSQQVAEMADWPAGVEVLAQRGVNGYRMKRHRVQCEGTACWRESAESHYPPTTEIVRRGTNASMSRDGFVPPAGDRHPPYSADRHMMVTQTADRLNILRR